MISRGTNLNEHLRELRALLRVHPHHVAEQEDVVRGVADLLGVENDLLELSSLGEALYHLAGDVGAQVHAQGQSGVRRFDEVPELFGALQLVLLEPLLQELFPALLQYRPAQLQRLELVQLALK